MNDDKLNQKFIKEYIDLLQNRDHVHRRIMLTFSGIPGSGKTTLARRLAKDLRAQYVQHDQIRQMIRDSGYKPEKFVIRDISHAIIDRIMTEDPNKFVILDASIDRAWPIFFGHVEEWGILPIVIRLNIPYDTLKMRLIERDGEAHPKLRMFTKQFENCKSQVVADFELDDDYDYDKLVDQIRDVIEQTSS